MHATMIIGLRNLSRRRLRTSLTGSMILVGTALIVFSVGLAEGTYDDMISLATRTYTGHFQVLAAGFNDKPSLFKTIGEPASVARELAAIPRIDAVTARVETAGLLASDDHTTGVMLIGVDPVTEAGVTTLAGALDEGRWFDPVPGPTQPGKPLPMVIGVNVAARLKLDIGGEVAFIGQAADGSIAAELFTIVGFLETGTDEVDGTIAFIRLADAQELLVLGQRVHRVIGVVGQLGDVEGVGAAYHPPPGLVFMDWTELLPELDQTIKADRAGLWIFLFIILAVVALGVANTMMMAVLERTREFGVLLALGTTPGRLVAVILSEAAWITLIGVVGGVVLGVAANLITLKWGIKVAAEPISYGGVMIDTMHATNTLVGTFLFPGIIFISGLLSSIPPALRAARLKPAQAIREG